MAKPHNKELSKEESAKLDAALGVAAQGLKGLWRIGVIVVNLRPKQKKDKSQ